MTERIKIGEVEIEVTFKDIKNLHLSVHPPKGHVTIASPLIYDLEKVKIYAATKLAWIKKEQRKFQEQLREEERHYITQESHYFLGERYLLSVTEAERNTVDLKGKRLLLTSKDINNVTLKESTVYKFYRKQLRRILTERVQFYSKQLGVETPDFKIRTMKTKWGSCSSSKERIWFNIELAKKPLICIDYIVVHELVHLLERHHNKRFILLMDEHFPMWRTVKKQLNDLPLK